MAARHPTPPKKPLLRETRRLIERHRGVLGKMARDVKGLRAARLSEVRLSRQAMSRRLEGLGLLAEADAQRQQNLVSGPRVHLHNGSPDPAGERAGLLAALKEARWNVEAARKVLTLSRRTMYRRMALLGIERPVETDTQRAARKRRLLRALERAGWVQTGAATRLGVSHTTVQEWMDEFEISRDEVKRLQAEAHAA